MLEITLNANGQLTLDKSLLEHLGVKAGEKITVKKLPDGSINIDKSEKRNDIMALAGILKSETAVKMSLEDMNQVITQGYAKRGVKGLK